MPVNWRDQRLVLEQGLQVALADFRLIGRVGSDELAPRGDIIDDRRDEMVVASAAEEADAAARRIVLRRQLAQVRGQFQFAQGRRHVERPAQPQFPRHHRKQIVDRFHADRLQHRFLIVGVIEEIGHRYESTKLEIRNPKQIQNAKVRMFQTPHSDVDGKFPSLRFHNSNLFEISDLRFEISLRRLRFRLVALFLIGCIVQQFRPAAPLTRIFTSQPAP